MVTLSAPGARAAAAVEEKHGRAAEASDVAPKARRDVPVGLENRSTRPLIPRVRPDRPDHWSEHSAPAEPLDALYQASLAVTSSLEPEEVLDAILLHVISLSGADDAYVFYFDGHELTYAAHRWRPGLRDPRGPFKVARPDGLTHTVAHTGRPLVVPDVNNHPLFEDWRWSGALLGLPLTIRDRIIGVMTIGFGSPQEFADSLLQLLDLLADQAAIAIQNAIHHSQMKQELKERRRAEARYQRLVDHLPTIICELAADGTTMFVSPAVSTVTGHRPEDLVGRNWWDVLYPGGLQEQVIRLHKMLRRGDVTDHEMTLVDRDDQPHVLSWSTANQWDSSRHLKRIIMIGIDITMRRRVEEERHRLQEQLFFAQRMDSIGRLAGGVAHDFNNLLTVVLGCAQIVKDALDEDSPHLSDMREIIGAGKRGAALARQLLLYSRKDVIEPRVVNVNRVVIGMGKLLERLIGGHIELALQLTKSVTSVYIDPGHLEQVVVNLVVNGRDAMPDGGTLRIVTEVREMEEALVRQYASICAGPHVRLAVTDTGCGMTQDVAASVFEPFFTTKPPDKGTGLGLSTVYGIVKRAGGSIWVQTSPDQGSTFEVLLPVVSGQEQVCSASSTEVPAIGRGEALLLVEDEEVLRQTLARFLSNQGYQVREAANGAEGWDVFCELDGRVDLLITDLVMPNLSGPKLIAKVRSRDPLLKVLCISGHPAVPSEIIGGGRTRTGFLRKPFTPSKLAAKVHEILS